MTYKRLTLTKSVRRYRLAQMEACILKYHQNSLEQITKICNDYVADMARYGEDVTQEAAAWFEESKEKNAASLTKSLKRLYYSHKNPLKGEYNGK